MPAKKSLGQHWLNDSAALEAICAAAELQASDTVLEIGPGHGALTQLLVQRVAQVIAVEKDENLAQNLSKDILENKTLNLEVGSLNGEKDDVISSLEVVTGDILGFDFTGLPRCYKVVANIPYYLTSNLIRVLSETGNPPATAVLLIQKEVAERVVAQPGAMSILSVTAQFYWRVSLGRLVEAKLFEPPPKVDSQVLILNHREKPLFDVDTKQFFHLVKAGFSQKRKTLTNSLSASYHLEKSQVRDILEKSQIDPVARAQTLSLTAWHDLYETISDNQ